MKNRFDNMPELIDLMDAEFATRPRDEWGRILDGAGLIWGPASTLTELAADPHAEAAGLFPVIDHPVGRFRTVAVPVHIDGAGVGPRGLAPDIGQHTEEVLEAAGLTPGEVAALAAGGAVGPCNLDEPDDGPSTSLTNSALGPPTTATSPREPIEQRLPQEPRRRSGPRANPTLKGPTTTTRADRKAAEHHGPSAAPALS